MPQPPAPPAPPAPPNPHGFAADLVHLPPSAIQVGREGRQRRAVNTAGLVESIRQNGIMKPILVERSTMKLVAGERRLASAIELGLSTVPVRYTDTLDPLDRQILEFDENRKRQDLVWQDIVQAICKVHQLCKARDPQWTLDETAERIGCTRPYISMCLRIGRDLDDEKVSSCDTMNEAYSLLGRRDERAMGNALSELLDAGALSMDAITQGDGTVEEVMEAVAAAKAGEAAKAEPSAEPGPPIPIVQSSILTIPFAQWLDHYQGPKFNLIHCDFPYGIGVFDGDVAKGLREERYDDTPETYFNLLATLINALPQVMSQSAHLMFWFSGRHEALTRQMFAQGAPFLEFTPFPLIWHKTDGKAVPGDYRRHPQHVYETCLLGIRGGRNTIKGAADVYGAPTDRQAHLSAKPVPMLRHFMSMLVDEHTTLLDPTCGSGSALQAAESLGAKYVLGLEVAEGTADYARGQLQKFRALRAAEALA